MREIEERRSIRRYLDEPVEEEKLQHVLAAARLTPTWANKQCWRLIVVRDLARREQLGRLCNVEGSEHFPNPIGKSFTVAPIVLVACADPNKSGRMYGQDFYLVDVGLMMENVMLAAREVGLGTCYVGIYDEPRIKDLLEIPSHIRVVGLTPLGYPESWPDARPRKELSEMVLSETWQ
jgi:nitroreductase